MSEPLLAELMQSGIKLEPRGDLLHVEAPRGAVTPELRQKIAAHKAELMAALKAAPVGLAPEIAAAYERLKRELEDHPGIKTAVQVIDPDTEPVLMAVAVRGSGYVTLRMPKANYDGFQLIEMVNRWNAKA